MSIILTLKLVVTVFVLSRHCSAAPAEGPTLLGAAMGASNALSPFDRSNSGINPFEVVSQRLNFLSGTVRGLTTPTPRFSWLLSPSTSAGNDVNSAQPAFNPGVCTQIAFEVQVSSDEAGNYSWTSGRVNSSTNFFNAINNPINFDSDTIYHWRVIVWLGVWNTSASTLSKRSSRDDGRSGTLALCSGSVTSQLAEFQTGIVAQSDWQAQWIAGGNMFRTELRIDAATLALATRASVFVSACQYYQLYINGQRISDLAPSMGSTGTGPRELDVGWTDFHHNRSYATLSVPLQVLQSQPNPDGSLSVAVAMMVGMGFCTQHQALLQLQITTPSSTPATKILAATNPATWNASSWGPILADSTYYGETYDARNEQPGFDTPGFTPPIGSKWTAAMVVAGSTPAMSPQMMQPIRRVAAIPAVSVNQIAHDRYVYDFGQEAAGWARLQLPAGVPSGTNVTLKFAEALQHEPFGPRNGSVWMGNLFWAYPVDHYITKAAADNSTQGQVYEPRFTYHGFRYVEVLFIPALPTPLTLDQQSLTMVVLRTDAASTSTLQLGNPLLQRISQNSWWTEAAALMSIPAGCAGRGERNGWIGDAAFASETELFDFDSVAFYTQWLLQVRDAQCPDGGILNGVPSIKCTQSWQYSDPSWQTVYPTLAFNLVQYHQAAEQVRQHYPHLQLYMDFLRSNYTTYGLAAGYSTWGDWNPAWPEPRNGTLYTGEPFVFTSPHVTAAASYVHDHIHMAAIADALGYAADAANYTVLLSQAREEYHKAFFDPEQNWYGDGTVVSQAVALWLGIVPAGLQAQVVSAMISQVTAQNYTMTSIGFIGVRYVFEALSKVNRTDVALQMLLQETYPSYGYAITNAIEPSTTLWESSDVFSMQQWLAESSRDHHYQVSINTFLRKYVSGLTIENGLIRMRPEAAAVALLPSNTDSLNTASLAAQTAWGNVSISWEFPLGRAAATTSLAPVPAPRLVQRKCRIVPQFPVPNGALQSPFRAATLICPGNTTIQSVQYAKFGRAVNQRQDAWTCYGPLQPPPPGACEADVSEIVLKACGNLTSCTLNATVAAFGNPCNLDPAHENALPPTGYQLAVRVGCSPEMVTIPRPAETAQSGNNMAAIVFRQTMHVPFGASAEAHVPVFDVSNQLITSGNNVSVWENGQFIPNEPVPGVSPLLTQDSRFVHFTVSPGSHTFVVWKHASTTS